MHLTLGSRGSPLALWQAHYVADRLRSRHAGLTVSISVIKTEGDRKLDVPLTASAGKGVFVKEIEDALMAGSIDLAVHSLKDLPTEAPHGLVLAAMPQRVDPRDALVSGRASEIAGLPAAALVATGSPRRRAQLLHLRPDLRFTLVRGNVDTRVRKLGEGQFDAIVLAAAGLHRLGITGATWSPLPTSLCLPAPGQGALAIEIRADDASTQRLVGAIDDPAVRSAVAAERAFLAALGAGCLAPAGALATHEDSALALQAMVATPDGTALRRDALRGPAAEAESLGRRIAERILDAGGDAILRVSRWGDGPS